MKAAVLRKIGQPFDLEDVPMPEIGPDEVLVETRTCGICRTDLHIQDGFAYVPRLPHIPGHEPAGVIVDVGREVCGLKAGQRVVPHLFVSGRDCFYSRTGLHAQAMHLDGIIGVTLNGAFAEYFKAPARNLLPLPDHVPFDAGGLVSCAVITAVHAYRKSGLQTNDTAVVLGAGGIGLILIQLLKSAGVRVVGVARSEESLKLAKQYGADLAVSTTLHDAVEQIRGFAGPSSDGVHCVFEMVGNDQTMKAAAEYVMRCGRVVVIGEEADYPAINTARIAQRELEIIGSRNGGIQDALDSIEMLARGIIRPPIAERFPLDRINEAMEHVRGSKAHGRVVITVKA